MPTQKGPTIISWATTQYPEYNRGRLWYAIAIILGLAAIVWALITTNFLFAIIIIIFAIIIALGSLQKPGVLNVEITETGLALNDAFLPYEDVDRFAIIYNPPINNHLYLAFKKGMRPQFGISLEDQDPLEIRDILIKCNLNEDVEWTEEPGSDTIGRILKL